jgi:hypothetical protein
MTPALKTLLDKARVIVEAMTPQERAAMHESQRRSRVRGELMLEHPEMSRAEGDALLELANRPMCERVG